MNLNEDLAILDADAAAQNAYDESKRLRFRAESLQPWTIARHSVAMTLGCKLITAVGPFVSEFLDSGNYSNIYRDVVIVLWLCSMDAEQVIEIDRADVGQSMTKAYNWAGDHGIDYGGPAYLEGVKLLDQILKQILASFFEVEQAEAAALAAGVKKKAYRAAWQIQIASQAAASSGETASFIIHHLPMAQALQWQAVAIQRFAELRFSRGIEKQRERVEEERILNS